MSDKAPAVGSLAVITGGQCLAAQTSEKAQKLLLALNIFPSQTRRVTIGTDESDSKTQRTYTTVPVENLILIPTATEKSLVEAALAGLVKTDNDNGAECRVCGFGPVAAAALTTEHLLSLQPKRVFLAGIAGGFEGSNNPMAVGSAHTFSTVGVDGVGVGSGDSFQSAVDMGWMPFAGDDARDPIGDQISLADDSPGRLLTVCAGSASSTQAQSRQQRYQADAEDMEGYAVAMACKLQNVPLKIIRGISNVAGDRDKANWQIADAMQAAFELLATEIKTLRKED